MTRIALLAGAALLALAACGPRESLLVGERQDVRADPSMPAARAISLPAPVSTDWTHKAARADHDMPHADFSADPRLIFAVPIGQAEDRRHRITADPVVSQGRVFTIDSRARVMAHSTAGQPLWSANVSPAGEPVDDASGGGLAVAGDRLYVATAFGQVLALDAGTGARVWVQDLGAPAAGAPTVSGGRVYVVGRDATAWALEAGNGRIAWTAQGTPDESGVTGGASPAVSGDRIVLPYSSRELRSLLEGGTELWTTIVAGSRLGRVYAGVTDITGDPVIDGGTVYAGSPSGRIAAIDLSSGERIWSTEEGAMSPVVTAGGSVFAVTDRAQLVRLDAATGNPVWAVDLPYYKAARTKNRQAVFAHYGPVLAGGRLWVASSDERLRAFDPTDGRLVAEVALPGGAATNMAVSGGVLYVVSSDGRLLAFR